MPGEVAGLGAVRAPIHQWACRKTEASVCITEEGVLMTEESVYKDGGGCAHDKRGCV